MVFTGVGMSITAFPVLARILTETTLITTPIGKPAMSTSGGMGLSRLNHHDLYPRRVIFSSET